MGEHAFPSMALAAYSESLIEGRRVIVFGDSTSGLAELLLRRGARLVHVYDSDLGRLSEATARGTSNEISYAPLGQSGVAVRDGAFDFGIIENLAASDDPGALVRRLRRALAARGCAVVATPNVEARVPLLRDRETVAEGLTYYDLYEFVTAEFDEVKMLGQLPFLGYAIVDFGAEGELDFALDTALLGDVAEEPDWYVAMVSHFPVSNDAFAVVQLPREESEPSSPALLTEVEELRRSNAQLEAEVERLRKAERLAPAQSVSDKELSQARADLEAREAKTAKLEKRVVELEESEANAATLAKRVAELEEQEAKAATLAKRVVELEQREAKAATLAKRVPELEQRGAKAETLAKRVAELEGRAKSAELEVEKLEEALDSQREQLRKTTRAAREALETKTQELHAARAKAEEVAVKAPEQDVAAEAHRKELATLRAEILALEEQLQDRGRECRRLRKELATSEKVGAELLAELEGLKEGGEDPNTQELGELQEILNRVQASETRRVADLNAAQWTIEQLQGQLRNGAVGAEPPQTPVTGDDAPPPGASGSQA